MIDLPEFDHTHLLNPPLSEVICQIRFVPQLEIAEKPPAEFQKRLRKYYPKYSVRKQLALEASDFLPNEYWLQTANELDTASIGVNFVALSTKAYASWEDYREKLRRVLDAHENSYEVPSITRIGLRYINEITQTNTGAQDLGELLGFLNDDLNALFQNDVWGIARKATSRVLLDDNGSTLSLRAGLDTEDAPVVVLDFDYFIHLDPPEEYSVEDLLGVLDRYHERVYGAFRWSIRPNAFPAFEPE